jgi:uncharacterized protein YcbX
VSDTTLSAIHVYPVKSCRAVALDQVTVAATGLCDDRLFQVVDGNGKPITQRQQAALATVQPTLIDGGLRLETDTNEVIELERPTILDTEVNPSLGLPVAASDAGDVAADWFSRILGTTCRLVAMTDEGERVIPGFGWRPSWADAAPVLVANTASLDWLVNRSTELFGMDRFRPNLTITGAEPWDEDTWRKFTIGNAEFGIGLAWPRCAIPQIDQQSGSRHKEPAKILKTYRWCAAGSVPVESVPDATIAPLLEGNGLFGIGCSVGPAGTELSVGDSLNVNQRGEPILTPPVAEEARAPLL